MADILKFNLVLGKSNKLNVKSKWTFFCSLNSHYFYLEQDNNKNISSSSSEATIFVAYVIKHFYLSAPAL